MANYANTKSIIAQNIYTNHEGQVTAEMVKTAANEIVNTLIAGGYLYAGVAKLTPTQTNPGSPDANVFYIATEPGTYTNFVGAGGSLVVADGEVAILKYNGQWSKETTGAATAAQVTELGQYDSDAEWVKVVTDANDLVLYGVKTDGKFYFGAGCPPQVQEAILDYIATKVDKESGKSLINSDFANSQEVVASPEWLEVVTDKDGNILVGINIDGEVKYGILPPQIDEAIYAYIHNYKKFPIDFGKPFVSDSWLVVGDGNEGGRNPYCIAIGKRVLANNTGIKNITVGYDNMQSCSGRDNTSMGYHASFRNTSGSYNASFGSESQDDNTTGKENTSIGFASLQRNNAGDANVAVGHYALNGNNAVPFDPDSQKSFSRNTAIGAETLYKASPGSDDNIAIGHHSLPSAKQYIGCIAIGKSVDCTKNNQAIIGGDNIEETIVRGDFIVKDTNGVRRKIIFNNDGTCSWELIN